MYRSSLLTEMRLSMESYLHDIQMHVATATTGAMGKISCWVPERGEGVASALERSHRHDLA